MWWKALLLVHAVASGVLVGSLTHLAVVVTRALRQPRPNTRMIKLQPVVSLVAFAVVFAVGTALYPHYRIEVRARWLDAHAPWASVLFDVKENLAVLLAPFLLAAWRVTRGPLEGRPGRTLVVASWVAAVGVWFNVLAGLLVVSLRSV